MPVPEVEERIDGIYGPVDWSQSSGVLHVAAIAADSRRVIAIGPAAPESAMDRFVLGLARARADAIVTTGAILRAEAELVHRYAEDPAEDAQLRRWRALVLGKQQPPALIVLSASGEIPADHPALSTALSGYIWTSDNGESKLPELPSGLTVELPDPRGSSAESGLLGALERAKVRLGARTILIEAGPSTAISLYPGSRDRMPRVDELLLSCFEGSLSEAAIGPPFVSEERVAVLFDRPRSRLQIHESSGPWRFERYR
jgi:riboflavin biosynthesis pyrimidine reductase